MRSSAMRRRTPSGTVPRSSPTTTAPAGGLQGDHRMELVRPVRHVGTMAASKPSGIQLQPLQTHDVVDPQVGGVSEGPPEHTDEIGVPVVRISSGWRGETPNPGRPRRRGRGALPVHSPREGTGGPDGVETVGMDADGEVGVERDRGCGGRELLGRHPLGVEVVPERGLGVQVFGLRLGVGSRAVPDPVPAARKRA